MATFLQFGEIGEKYDLQVLRFFMLSAHYRSPLNFSGELMAAAKNSLERILTAVDRLRNLKGQERPLNEEENTQLQALDLLCQKFDKAMDDDFNTADAIAAIFEMVKLANIQAQPESAQDFVNKVLDTIVKYCDILGIITDKKEEMLDEDVEALIQERQAARKAKNFARADEIRQMLLEKGIILEDTREGVKWKRA